MIEIGNQVIIKSTEERGFVLQVLTEDLAVVGTKSDSMLTAQLHQVSNLYPYPCEYGANGVCDYSCNRTAAPNACIYCKYEKLTASHEVEGT